MSVAAYEHPPEVREATYQVWAYIFDRRDAPTARALVDGEYREAIDLPDGTTAEQLRRVISNWSRDHGWDERFEREVHAVAPALRVRSQMTLALAQGEAASFLRDVVNGRVDAQEAKARTPAALGVLDRTGMSPVGSRMGLGEIDAPPSLTAHLGNLDDLTTEALRQREQDARDRVRQLTERGKVTGLAR